jgi:cell division protein FtsB
MIGEQYAVARKPVLRQRRHEGLLTWAGRSVAVKRERLAHLTADSTLVQLMLAMTCVAAAGLLYLAQASQVSVLQYNMAGLQYQQTTLNARNASLRATATQLQSLQRIDTAATSQLHMTKPDLSTAIWITAPVPPAVHIYASNADTVAAEQASQPLAWMTRFVTVVRSSL